MNRKLILFGVLLLYFVGNGLAQPKTPTLHELKAKLSKSEHDTIKVETYRKLGIHYFGHQYDSAYYFTNQALNLSKKIGYKNGLIHCYMQLGSILKNQGEFEKSITHFRKALSLTNRPVDLGMIFNNLGNTYLKLGLLDSALSNMLKGLNIKLEGNDTSGIVSSYINLSNFYCAEKQFNEAKQYCLKGLTLGQKINDPVRLVKLYCNLGNIYFETTNIDSAEYFYNKALSFQDSKNDLAGTIIVYLNLGNIHKQRNEFKPALTMYQKSLELSKLSGNVYQEINSLQNIGSIYENLREYKKAISYFEEALYDCQQISSKDKKRTIMLNLSSCYEKLDNYALAFQYFIRADSLDTELYNEAREAQLAEMQTKFKTEQKEKELVIQKAFNEKKVSERNGFIVTSILLFVLLGIVIIVYIKTKHINKTLASQKKIIEKRENEKELLLRELHHRAKNNLQLVSSLLNLQANQLKDTEAADAVKEGQARVEAMALIHRDLYRRENVTKVNLKTYLGNMVSNLMSSYNFSSSSMTLVMDVSEIELEADLAIPLGLIANELISNAFKHAFVNHQHPELVIVAGEMTENELHLLVRDNGHGIENGTSKEESFGVTMVHSLVKQLHGSITFENSSGCVATLVVPLRKDELVEI